MIFPIWATILIILLNLLAAISSFLLRISWSEERIAAKEAVIKQKDELIASKDSEIQSINNSLDRIIVEKDERIASLNERINELQIFTPKVLKEMAETTIGELGEKLKGALVQLGELKAGSGLKEEMIEKKELEIQRLRDDLEKAQSVSSLANEAERTSSDRDGTTVHTAENIAGDLSEFVLSPAYFEAFKMLSKIIVNALSKTI